MNHDDRRQSVYSERRRYFSDTFPTRTPESDLYAYTKSSKKHKIVVEEGDYHQRCCHIIKWMYAIALLEVLALFASLLATIVEFAIDYVTYGLENFLIVLIACIVGAVVIFYMLKGVRTEQFGYLIPHMVCQVVSIVALGVGVIVYGIGAANSEGRYEHDEDKKQLVDARTDEKEYEYDVAVVVICALGLVIQMAFYAQVSKCYRYLKHKKLVRRHLKLRRRSSV